MYALEQLESLGEALFVETWKASLPSAAKTLAEDKLHKVTSRLQELALIPFTARTSKDYLEARRLGDVEIYLRTLAYNEVPF